MRGRRIINKNKVLLSLFVLNLAVSVMYFKLTDYFVFIAAATSLISLFSLVIILEQKSEKDFETSSFVNFLQVANISILVAPFAFLFIGGIGFM